MLKTFFAAGRLTEITTRRRRSEGSCSSGSPSSSSHSFRYSEQEVNVLVGAFFNDYASLRRYLVDEGGSTATTVCFGVPADAWTCL